MTDTYLFDAFGNLLSKTGSTANDFLYTGEQYDANTGFYYLRARYMNPSTGTFTSMDAYAGTIFDPVSLHKYLYANANPVMNRDPSGYFTLTEMETAVAIQAIIGAAFGSLTSSLMSMLFYDTHGGDMQSPERIQVAWEGFWKGALLGAAGGAFFGGLAILGTEFILANVMSGLCFYFMSLSAFGQAARFYMNGDILWGDIFLASAGICFIFSGFYFGKAWSMAFDDFYVPASVGKAGAADDVAGSASKGGVDDLNLKINIGQQNKHIPGTNNYKQELANGKLKSILSADPQQLLDDFAGTGQKIGTNKERVDFGNVIGKYVNPETGEAVDTTVGIIHYGKNGAHIVPARPK